MSIKSDLYSTGCERVWIVHSWWCGICTKCWRFRGKFSKSL